MSITIPHTFHDGDLIVASQFNDNFGVIADAVNNLYITSPQTISVNTTWATRTRVNSDSIITVNDGVTLKINGPFEAGLYQVFNCVGTGTVIIRQGSISAIYPEWWGANGNSWYNGTNEVDSTAAFKKAVICAKNCGAKIVLSGKYRINSTVSVLPTDRNSVVFEGSYASPSSYGNMASLYFYGTGPLIEIGSSNGNDFGAAAYDGVQGVKFKDIAFFCVVRDTPLLSGVKDSLGNLLYYGGGRIGVRDWRGGDLVFESCNFTGFEYGVWAVQSDFDKFDHCAFSRNHIGIYLAYRSSQAHIRHCVSTFNDIAIKLDTVTSTVIDHHTTNGDGSISTSPFTLVSNYTGGTSDTIFRDCWFEHYGEIGEDPTLIIPSFISIGESGVNPVRATQVIQPVILNNAGTTLPRTESLVSTGDLLKGLTIDTTIGRGDSSYVDVNNIVKYNHTSTVVYFYTVIIDGFHIVNHNYWTKTNGSATDPQVSIFRTDIASYLDSSGNARYDVSPKPTSSSNQSDIRFFRGTTAANSKIVVYTADGTSSVAHVLDAKGNIIAGYGSAGAYNQGHVQLGNYHLWVDSSGRLRIKSSAPASDTDGTVVGTQA